MLIFGYIICGIAIAASVPVFLSSLYLIFLALSSLIPRRIKVKEKPSTRIAVIIPAHDEEKNIEKNLAGLIAEIDYPSDLFQIIVIADNCKDSTSYLASFTGARVLERSNDWKTGKGHALEWAFGKLKKENFDLYLIIDADTYIEKNALRYLDAEFSEGHIAMQLPLKTEKSEDSWSQALKNAIYAANSYLQPRGRDRIGFSSPLYGNGSCLAKEILEKISFEAGEHDDMLEYNLKLIFAGEKVRFLCGKKISAVVSPKTGKLSKKLRKGLSRKYSGRLLKESLKGNFTALESLINMLIPPVDMLLFALFVILFSGITLFLSGPLPGCEPLVRFGLIISGSSLLCLLILPVYILIGMLEKRVSLKSWASLLLWPFILVYYLIVKFRNIFNKENKTDTEKKV